MKTLLISFATFTLGLLYGFLYFNNPAPSQQNLPICNKFDVELNGASIEALVPSGYEMRLCPIQPKQHPHRSVITA